MNNKNRFTLRLSDNQLNFLKELAEKEDRSISGAIRSIINEFQTGKEEKQMGKTNITNDRDTGIPRFKRSNN